MWQRCPRGPCFCAAQCHALSWCPISNKYLEAHFCKAPKLCLILSEKKSHCSFDEKPPNIKRSQWEPFMSRVEGKKCHLNFAECVNIFVYAGSAPNCLHRFSSTLTVLYWSIDNSLRPSNLWFSPFLFTGKDQTNSTNCAFPICQTPLHYLHEIGKKIGSLERMTVLEWLFMCLSFRSRKGTKVPITVKMFAI